MSDNDYKDAYCIEGCGNLATTQRILTRIDEEYVISVLGVTNGPLEVVELVCDFHAIHR